MTSIHPCALSDAYDLNSQLLGGFLSKHGSFLLSFSSGSMKLQVIVGPVALILLVVIFGFFPDDVPGDIQCSLVFLGPLGHLGAIYLALYCSNFPRLLINPVVLEERLGVAMSL